MSLLRMVAVGTALLCWAMAPTLAAPKACPGGISAMPMQLGVTSEQLFEELGPTTIPGRQTGCCTIWTM